MIINFLGDSITQGVGTTDAIENCFSALISKKLNCTTNNYGISGTRIARKRELSYPHYWDMDFNFRYQFLDKKADFTFIFGGINDYVHGDAKIGSLDDETEFTFCGAVNLLIDKLQNDFGERFAFILPLPKFVCEKEIYGEHRKLITYVDKLREILSKKNVKYLDLYNLFPAPVSDLDEGYFFDGIHPNDEGHKLLANYIIDYMKKINII